MEAIDASLKQVSEIPAPKEHWLKGSIGLFEPDQFHTYLNQLQKQLGTVFKIRFLNKPVVVIADPVIAENILKSRPDIYKRVSTIEPVFRELGIHGAFSAEGDEWVKQRKLINPAFKPSQIKRFLPDLKLITERLCHVLDKTEDPFDFQTLIKCYSVDITTLLAFGYDLNSLKQSDSELQKALSLIFPRLSERLKAPVPYWRYFKLKVDREVDEAVAVVEKHVRTFIQLARKNLEKNATPQNILESLVQEHQGDDSDIIGNTTTLLLAGEDTTANTIAWCIDYLADNVDIQDKLFEEIQAHYPKNSALEWDDLDKFPLVLGAIQESLRLKPVAPFVYLEPKKDVEIGGYQIPKGTMMTVLLSPNNRCEKLFHSPDTFDPERWIHLSDADRKHYALELMPFGAGPRMCPGMQLAFTEMKLALIEMIRRFKFTKERDIPHTTESFDFTLSPKGLIVNTKNRLL